MTDTDPTGSSAGTAGPAERLLRLGERLLSLVVEAGRTRAELLAVEFAIERQRLFRLLALGVIFGVSVLLGLAFASMLVIAYFWDTHRLAAIAIVALVYGIIAVVIAVVMMRGWQSGSLPFANTLDTLQRDYAAMQSRLRRQRADEGTTTPEAFLPGDQP